MIMLEKVKSFFIYLYERFAAISPIVMVAYFIIVANQPTTLDLAIQNFLLFVFVNYKIDKIGK